MTADINALDVLKYDLKANVCMFTARSTPGWQISHEKS